MTVVGILAALAGVVVPVVGKVKSTSARVACASNLRQIGSALLTLRAQNRGQLPARPSGLDQTNPHVMKYKAQPESVARLMELAAGTRDVYYCPGNPERRGPSGWWPFTSGTIAATYQFPFWLKSSLWLVPPPDYRRLAPEAVLAADYLGSDTAPTQPLAWNHRPSPDGSPEGMNLLLGDGHVEWRTNANGWVLWGRSNGPIDWYVAR